ncbi:MAG: hypothetical protein KKG59_01885 [Nanoarchaeota archaeon]|nr:hypothetical protein [Nanoarchaeota archaeon]
MAMTPEQEKMIIQFVRREPKSIQDIARHIQKCWVTTNSYVTQIKERTGVLNIKTFRSGTQGALKIVYYDHAESLATDRARDELYNQIKIARNKQDFDFFDIFQFVPDSKKKAFFEEYSDSEQYPKAQMIPFLRSAKQTISMFSGNLSFINIVENKTKVIDVLEELAKQKIRMKILCKISIASLSNVARLQRLLIKYSDFIEIRHCAHPLRGFIIDETLARFKNEQTLASLKSGELNSNIRAYYEIYDSEWIAWIQKVFWNFFRVSLDYQSRVKQFEKFANM